MLAKSLFIQFFKFSNEISDLAALTFWLRTQNINKILNEKGLRDSNEFFDCFPVRQFIFKKVWFEKYVSFNNQYNYFLILIRVDLKHRQVKYLQGYQNENLFQVC